MATGANLVVTEMWCGYSGREERVGKYAKYVKHVNYVHTTRNRRTFPACGTETREHVNTVSLFPVLTAMRQSADHFYSGSGMTGMTGVAGMTGMNNQIAEPDFAWCHDE